MNAEETGKASAGRTLLPSFPSYIQSDRDAARCVNTHLVRNTHEPRAQLFVFRKRREDKKASDLRCASGQDARDRARYRLSSMLYSVPGETSEDQPVSQSRRSRNTMRSSYIAQRVILCVIVQYACKAGKIQVSARIGSGIFHRARHIVACESLCIWLAPWLALLLRNRHRDYPIASE